MERIRTWIGVHLLGLCIVAYILVFVPAVVLIFLSPIDFDAKMHVIFIFLLIGSAMLTSFLA